MKMPKRMRELMGSPLPGAVVSAPRPLPSDSDSWHGIRADSAPTRPRPSPLRDLPLVVARLLRRGHRALARRAAGELLRVRRRRAEPVTGQQRIGAHTDYGSLTIFYPT